MNEFVSDSFQSQTLSKDLQEVQEGIKRLGTKKANGMWLISFKDFCLLWLIENFQFNLRKWFHYSIQDDDWEKELQAELQDYELGSDGSGHTGGPDADDIEEMLDAEESHGDLK